MAVIGDSLSSGEYESYFENQTDWHDYYEYSWGQFIARKYGIDVLNFSRGGLTAKTFFDYAHYNNSFVPEKACQSYVIALGRNDIYHWEKYENGFGSIEDVDFNDMKKNKDSFVGHYVKIIQKIREIQPKARIFVVTMPECIKDDTETAKKCDLHAEFLRSLPNYFDFLYVIDLRKLVPIHDKEFIRVHYCGGHLNAMGYLLTAEQIAGIINDIIIENSDDFCQVAFIGKNIHNTNERW